jgi:hypothetical protein
MLAETFVIGLEVKAFIDMVDEPSKVTLWVAVFAEIDAIVDCLVNGVAVEYVPCVTGKNPSSCEDR